MLVGNGLQNFGLSIKSDANKDAVRWIGDDRKHGALWDQKAFCNLTEPDHSLLQKYALASIFFSSSLTTFDDINRIRSFSLEEEKKMMADKISSCRRKDEDDVGWPRYSSIFEESVCDWEGVSCTANDTVYSLDFSKRGWTGTIPDEFLVLKESLVHLDLSFNDYFGPIPSMLGGLESMLYLDLSVNDLTGTIPTALGNLTNAYEIYLEGNELGSVPENICNMKDSAVLINLRAGKDCSCCSYCPSFSLPNII